MCMVMIQAQWYYRMYVYLYICKGVVSGVHTLAALRMGSLVPRLSPKKKFFFVQQATKAVWRPGNEASVLV